VNVWGVADGRPYDHLLPGCRSVLVVGSGGATLWRGAVRRGQLGPHPIDDWVRDHTPPDHPGRRWIRCADDAEVFVDFRVLAHAAGLGHPGRIGLLLHPTYGPWWGLRAACFTTDALPVTGPLSTPSPCATCTGPCMTACPARAVEETLDWAACGDWQRDHDSCHGGCLARAACPVGSSHAYGPAQHRYHHHHPSRPETWARAVRDLED
jgi:hypothetical protein